MPSAAPAQAEVAGPPRTELEELQIRANQVTDDVSDRNNIFYPNLRINELMMQIFKFFSGVRNFSPWIVHVVCWPSVKR